MEFKHTTSEADEQACADTDRQAYNSAYNYALGLLARREYSEHGLREKIKSKHAISAADTQRIIQKLYEYNYLCDERFASAFYRSRASRYGLERITQELRQKGIAEHLIEAALEGASQTVDEYSPIYTNWQRKYGVLPADYKEKSKQMRFLKYRGFSFEQIEKLYALLAAND